MSAGRHRRSRPLSPAMRFFFSRIFPLIFLLVGLATLYFGIRGTFQALASDGWPSVEGVILESEVERRRGSGSDGSTTYRAAIFYEFEVDNVTYNGDRIAFGDFGSGNPAHARRVVNRYPADMTLPVYYRPDNPEVAVLEPGVQLQAFFLPAFGAVFFLAGLGMMRFLPRAMRPPEDAPTETDPGSAEDAEPRH